MPRIVLVLNGLISPQTRLSAPWTCPGPELPPCCDRTSPCSRTAFGSHRAVAQVAPRRVGSAARVRSPAHSRSHIANRSVTRIAASRAADWQLTIRPQAGDFSPFENDVTACPPRVMGSRRRQVAADSCGNVFVFSHAQPRKAKNEASRHLWIARSANRGKSFAAEKIACSDQPESAVAAESRAFADADDTTYVLFRAATQVSYRDMYLLTSLVVMTPVKRAAPCEDKFPAGRLAGGATARRRISNDSGSPRRAFGSIQ